jgi:glycogen(starch) synthase
VRDIVADFKPDLLHVNAAEPGSFIFLRGAATGDLPRIVTLHAPIRPTGKDGLQRRLSTDAERVVTVSQAMFDDALAAMPAVRPKLSVIRNALPIPDATPTVLPFSPPRLLCFGRIVREKGFDVVVRALANLRQQGFTVSLDIAGDGPEMPTLVGLVESLGMDGQVRFLGWVSPDGIPDLIDTATAVVVPSRWPEPFGLVALQAAQMGRPAIATAVGGLPEVVAHGLTGLVVEPDDEQAMADAIVALLSDARKARQLGEYARQRARKEFDFGTLVDAHEHTYAEARDESASRPDDRDMVRVDA